MAAGHPPFDTTFDENICVRAAAAALNGRDVSAWHVEKKPLKEGHVMSTVFMRRTRDHEHVLPSGTTPALHSPFALREYLASHAFDRLIRITEESHVLHCLHTGMDRVSLVSVIVETLFAIQIFIAQAYLINDPDINQ
jgi:hypothetical protein